MLVSATPTHSLRSQMEGGLEEALQWTIGVASDDADVQCRTLASHVLSLSQNKLKEVSCYFCFYCACNNCTFCLRAGIRVDHLVSNIWTISVGLTIMNIIKSTRVEVNKSFC